MSNQVIALDLLVELPIEQQELLSGGQNPDTPGGNPIDLPQPGPQPAPEPTPKPAPKPAPQPTPFNFLGS